MHGDQFPNADLRNVEAGRRPRSEARLAACLQVTSPGLEGQSDG